MCVLPADSLGTISRSAAAIRCAKTSEKPSVPYACTAVKHVRTCRELEWRCFLACNTEQVSLALRKCST